MFIRAASKNLEFYAISFEEHLMQDHKEAMECMDCETCIQLGLDAYKWLVRADEQFNQSVAQGIMEFDKMIADTIENIYSIWYDLSNKMNTWIDLQITRGFELNNLRKFRECQRLVKAAISESDEMPKAIIDLRDSAIEEYDRGETSEFV